MHSPLRLLRLAARLAVASVALAMGGAAQTACGGNCKSVMVSQLRITGLAAIPDDLISSLAIEICVDDDCAANTSGDAASAVGVLADGGGDSGAIECVTDLYESTGRYVANVSLVQVSAGSYQISSLFLIHSSGVNGHVTVTITSGGTPIYQASAQASCTSGQGCMETTWDNCTLQLP